MHWADRVGRRLKLRDLHILLAVVQRGSMAKAAAELAISQPAISKAIADIEHTVGLRLLDRGRNGVEPTVYGRALVRRSTAIFDELKHGVQELELLANSSKGELSVGGSESVAAGLLPAAIEHFSRQYPGVRLNVAQAPVAPLHYRELRERSIDLFLGPLPSDFAEDDLDTEILFDDPLMVVAGRRSPWARSRKLKFIDLLEAPWVLPPAETLPGVIFGNLFRAAGVSPPRAPITTLSIHVICQLTASGRFVTALPASILRFNAHRFALKSLPIRLAAPPRPVGIVKVKNRTPTPVVERFLECLRAMARKEKAARP